MGEVKELKSSKVRLFILEMYFADCSSCGCCFNTGICEGDAEEGEDIVCEECDHVMKVGKVDDY